jgi:hypothetical protein
MAALQNRERLLVSKHGLGGIARRDSQPSEGIESLSVEGRFVGHTS